MARFVFGKAIIDSQTCFLNTIPTGVRILILGGGTGWLLEKISEQNKFCKIWYVELSGEMIKRSRSRKTTDEIYFIQGTEQDIPAYLKVDVIITNFYLDLFPEKKLYQIIRHLSSHANESCIWLATDFVKQSWWHKPALSVMYTFFRLTCRIEAAGLPKWSSSLEASNWREISTQSRFGSFIKSSVWQRR